MSQVVIEQETFEKHADALWRISCQDQSVRVRRAAFVAWISMLKSAQAMGVPCALTDVPVSKCILERCTDRWVGECTISSNSIDYSSRLHQPSDGSLHSRSAMIVRSFQFCMTMCTTGM